MRFFISDNHFWHANVIKYCDRPFSSVEEMNEKMVQYWNEIVTQDDQVYYLGDFSMAFRSVELFTNRLLGTKYLIAGNHDMCHSVHKKSRNPENKAKWIQKYIDNGFSSVKEEDFIEIDGIKFRMHHMPYQNLEDKDARYQNKRVTDDGIPLLHGHTHSKEKITLTKNGTIQIHVGVDAHNFWPISEQQVIELYRSIV